VVVDDTEDIVVVDDTARVLVVGTDGEAVLLLLFVGRTKVELTA